MINTCLIEITKATRGLHGLRWKKNNYCTPLIDINIKKKSNF